MTHRTAWTDLAHWLARRWASSTLSGATGPLRPQQSRRTPPGASPRTLTATTDTRGSHGVDLGCRSQQTQPAGPDRQRAHPAQLRVRPLDEGVPAPRTAARRSPPRSTFTCTGPSRVRSGFVKRWLRLTKPPTWGLAGSRRVGARGLRAKAEVGPHRRLLTWKIQRARRTCAEVLLTTRLTTSAFKKELLGREWPGTAWVVMGGTGIEPVTSGLSSRRSPS
jgi:hypothetical protein